MAGVELLHKQGLEAVNAGRLTVGRRLLEEAAATAEGPFLARIQVSLSYVLAEFGEVSQALELCDSVRADTQVDDSVRGLAESQRAVLLTRGSRATEALSSYERALRLLESGDHVSLGRAFLNRGTIHLQLNDAVSAAADFDIAARRLAEGGLSTEAAMAGHNLGYALLLRGDLAAALGAMDAARTVLSPLSVVSKATCDQDRAEVLFAAGRRTEARKALEAAALAYRKRRLRRHQAEAELVLARQLGTTHPAAAERWASTAERGFRRTGHEIWAIRASGVALTASIARGRRGPRLRAEADRIAEALESQGFVWEARSVELAAARVSLVRGETDEAMQRVSSRGLRPRAPLDVRLTERDVRAQLASARGMRSLAFNHLRRGLADLSEWQSSFGSLDLQTNVIGQGSELAARGLQLAMESPSRPVLFEWSERARMLASRVQPVRAPADPTLAADLAELRGSPTPTREAELRKKIREQAWQKKGSGEVIEPIALTDLQDHLGDRALVSHIVAGGRVVALVVTSDGAKRVSLGDRKQLDDLLGGLLPDLDVAAGDLTGPLGTMVRGELAVRLDRLSNTLIRPVLDQVGDRAVILTPSALLAGVPWTLLTGLVGRPVTVAQSATSWILRDETPLRTNSAGLIAGPRVARAHHEVADAAGEWPREYCLTGEQATASAASELASKVDVLHVAAHGRHSAESPLFSGLQLADGTWFGYDVDQLESVPDVVLLSACEVGRSNVRWGEELIGMTAAWLHAGARCVVASPAAVADEAARDTLVEVHRGLAGGRMPAEALADAVPAPRAESAPAPFVCFG